MSRTLSLSLDAPVAVGEILAAFAEQDYWQARLAAFDGGTATLDSLVVDADGGVTAALTVSLFANRLPKVVTTLVPGEFTMARTESWRPGTDGGARGAIDVSVPGAPVSAVGTVSLIPTDAGSRLEFTTTVRVKIPLVGGQVESFIVSRLGDEISAVQRFTNAWIATNR